jgi:phenol 2-monooxygenase (NADPH)
MQFTTAIGINYQSSLLVAKGPDEHQDGSQNEGRMSAAKSTTSLATNCKPGTRFPSYKLLNQYDTRPWELHHKMPSDGRFRIVVFAGDISVPSQKHTVNMLGEWLATSLLPKYRTVTLSPGSDPHTGMLKFRTERDPSVIDVLLAHSAPREEIEILRDLHEVYHPFDPKLGWDYDKVSVDGLSYHEGHAKAYDGYGVDRTTGAVVGVRPDGYVGLVTAVGHEGWNEIERWFDGILEPVETS